MTVLVANRMKGQIKSAADFKGTARGRGRGLLHEEPADKYLAARRGCRRTATLPSCSSMRAGGGGIQGLKAGQVGDHDLPGTDHPALQATGLVPTPV